jgi:hypothetical protein
MKGKCRAAAVGMSILFVGAALPDFLEAQLFEKIGNFLRFQNRRLSHQAT